MKVNSRTTLSVILIFCYTYSNTEATTPKKAKIGKYYRRLFPTDPLKNFTLTIPKECEKIGYCEKIPNYPSEFVSKMFLQLSAKNIKPYSDPIPSEDDDDNCEYESLCKTEEVFACPQALKAENNKWHLVLNTGVCEQRIHAVKCETQADNCHEGPTCSNVATFQNSYKGVCHQRYMKKLMIVFDTESAYVAEDAGRIPTSCHCVALREN